MKINAELNDGLVEAFIKERTQSLEREPKETDKDYVTRAVRLYIREVARAGFLRVDAEMAVKAQQFEKMFS